MKTVALTTIRNLRARAAVVVLLALLLTGMQVAAQWHALDHIGEWMHQSHEVGLQTAANGDSCAMCALFAGGAHAAATDLATLAQPVFEFTSLSRPISSAAIASPSPYSSRAPPSIL